MNKKTFSLVALFVATFALPTLALSPIIREYEQNPRNVNRPVVRELAPPELPPSAGVSPFAFSIFPKAEIPPEDWDITLLRINLFVGRHRNVYALDVGVIGNQVTGEFVGVQAAGLFNQVGTAGGALQFAGVLNRSGGDFIGLQVASAANITDGTLSGLQVGLVNRTARLNGLQVGFFNIAETGSGVQIGFWNSAQSLEGLQIGLCNCNADSTIPFFPVINFAF